MAKVKIQGHASGTGVLTVTAPNTSTDRTITLPDETATLSTFDPDGAVTINDSGADVDFRVKSATNDNTIFVQGHNGAVGIGVNEIGTNNAFHIENGESYLIIKDAQQMGIRLYGDDTNVIYSHDKTADTANNYLPTGGITWNHADGTTIFYTGGFNPRMTIDSTGAVTKPLQPAFLVEPSSSQNDIAINSEVKVLFANEIFDNNADFNTGTNTFQAPVTGKYQINVSLRVENMDITPSYMYLKLITSNRGYYQILDPRQLASDPVYWGFAWSHVVDMDASDNAYVSIYQAGGAAQMDINTQSQFSGYLLG